MKIALLIVACCLALCTKAQRAVFPSNLAMTNIAQLRSGDSLTYYQCHVDEASQELTTTSGQKISTKAKKLTITEKYVVSNREGVYTVRYYVSGFNEYPNKKFAYLTLTEVANWGFEFKHSGPLTLTDLMVLGVFERKTHDIVHYELKINKTCPNEIVIVHGKDRTQLIVEGDYLLSRYLSAVKG